MAGLHPASSLDLPRIPDALTGFICVVQRTDTSMSWPWTECTPRTPEASSASTPCPRPPRQRSPRLPSARQNACTRLSKNNDAPAPGMTPLGPDARRVASSHRSRSCSPRGHPRPGLRTSGAPSVHRCSDDSGRRVTDRRRWFDTPDPFQRHWQRGAGSGGEAGYGGSLLASRRHS